MEYMSGIVLLCVAFLVYAAVVILSIHHRRKLVQELVLAQLNGKSIKSFFVHFEDCSPEQLLYPLTNVQLACIRNCRDFESTVAEVKGIHPIDTLLGRYYFTVHYYIRGTNAAGQPFAIQEAAYLRVCYHHRRQVIYWIVGSREPF